MIKQTRYDVAILGGGLAGLTLAIQAARCGYAVALFEKDHYPRHKVCGEYISLESKPFLEELGLPVSNLDLPEIHRLQTTDMQGRSYGFSLPLGGFGISRYALDHALYQLALQAGADVYCNTKVLDAEYDGDRFMVRTSQGNINALVAVGAYGKRSNLDLKWQRAFVQNKAGKLSNYIGVKYHIRYHHPADVIALHNFENGYCGISQVEGGICCLCYLTTAANLQKGGNDVRRMEEQILFRNRALRHIFSEAQFLWKDPLVISQVSFAPKPAIENHLLMLGDAAGLIAPLCGNGMSMAMHSSKLAFSSICDFLEKKINRPQMEKQYTDCWRNEFSTRLQVGRLVQRNFGNSVTTRIFLGTMHRFPWLAQRLIGATHGKHF